ncbi:putative protein EIN4-like [Capsicum annuum]|nr:putative protein EIN4-like [Capsicum annuum]KAF3683233.1 putative protein EIN4-like [Capsicum annuum]
MPFAIRMVRVIEETFMLHHGPGVRWYVMADDDTVLMIDNLVNVLTKYDHTKYYYVGMNSECIVSNFGNSFQMAFGGAGYALSYPLAQAVAKNMDTCIKRYPYLYGSDHILQACIADLGVTITLEKGFHQIDLRRDISGFLSAHPQSPFLSLHHLDLVAPIFPSMNRFEALNHLMKAASVDQSRLLQQSTCYNKLNNWTFSVSWGYSVQIYDKIQSQSYLAMPIETFGEWRKGAWPPYMFNVRGLKSNNGNSCGEVPNVLFFDSLEGTRMNHIVTTYVKKTPRSCGNDDHPIDGILKIRVFSPMHKLHVGADLKNHALTPIENGLFASFRPFDNPNDLANLIETLSPTHHHPGGQHVKAQDLVIPRAQGYVRKDHFEHDLKLSRVWKVAWLLTLMLTREPQALKYEP